MRHMRTLFWVVLLVAGTGLLEHGMRVDSAGLHLLAGFALSYLCFLWYRADSDARGFARTRWLSVGVAAFTPGAIPYYLMRSRGEAERGRALIAYAACLGLVALAAWGEMTAHATPA